VTHIPMDDINEIWQQTQQMTWSALMDVLHAQQETTDGISDTLVDAMTKMSNEFQSSGRPFPASLKQLYDVFNQQLQQAVAK
jgi:hypothetical protein